MMEARRIFMEHGDHVRQRLLLEPRGYPCQNANYILPSSIAGAAYGFVIAEQNKIYPLMSGHNCICVATALLEAGLVTIPAGGGRVSFGLEAPAGLILIQAECSAEGKAERCIFRMRVKV
jgi:proline racemase